ncbi:MAG: hypothetical protein LBQ54_04180 [Planctomycetaceae bacterium]|nr:hypothetical protein [Planctomycetaceae bacterium]
MRACISGIAARSALPDFGSMLLHRNWEAPAGTCLMVTAFHSVASRDG